MTFLELCQMVARESGTVSGTLPTAVTGQTGREGKIVYWTQEAWRRIQNSRRGWRWMRAEFEKPIGASSQRYTAAAFSLDRLADWITEPDTLTVYDTAIGVADEQSIPFIPFDEYRARYERGTRIAGRPVHFSVSDAGELCFPKMDTDYTVRGLYRKTPQSLAANTDIPEMPLRFHDLIAWDALQLLAEHDEADFHVIINRTRKSELMADLMRDQLPRVATAGTLA
jgi:hypothetical protein